MLRKIIFKSCKKVDFMLNYKEFVLGLKEHITLTRVKGREATKTSSAFLFYLF